jgi:hypothetical protein
LLDSFLFEIIELVMPFLGRAKVGKNLMCDDAMCDDAMCDNATMRYATMPALITRKSRRDGSMVEMATRRGLAHGAQASFGAHLSPVRTAGL